MLINQFGIPGQTAAVVTATNEFIWGGDVSKIPVLMKGEIMDGAARDAGNSPTTVLRPGLILGRVAATNKIKQFDPDATDGTQYAIGVLAAELVVVDPLTGADQDKMFPMVVWAPVKAKALYIEGTALTSSTDQYLARRQLGGAGFRFDDDVAGWNNGNSRIAVKAADYTVVAADNGTFFQATTGNVTFTLPAIKAGLEFRFLRVDGFNLVVASAEGDNMIVGNDASADSITFSTGGNLIGAQVLVRSAYVNGTLKWIPELPYVPFGTGLNTLAFAIAT